MSSTPALSCKAALSEMDRLHPSRSRVSDGIMGDPSHQARASDHNLGNAFDVTHDPKSGVDTYALADELRKRCKAGIEHRVKYIISNRRIASSIGSWAWRPYDGVNPHAGHMHVSIFQSARTDTRPWWTKPRPAPQPAEGESEMTDAEMARLINAIKTVLGNANSDTDSDPTHDSLADIRRDLREIKKKLGI